jgi:hypothetical protein
MRRLVQFVVAVAAVVAAQATTLQRLSLDDMIRQSTSVVRAKVTGSYTTLRGQDIWTFYQLQVLETLKPGAPAAGGSVDVGVPGGTMKGVRQAVAGAPALTPGTEYVVFLWTSRSGLTQVIGLSQGLFLVTHDDAGNSVLTRPAAAATMLDQNGIPVADQAVSLSLVGLRARVGQGLGSGVAK